MIFNQLLSGKIGKNVKIIRSFIWDNVIIEDNCLIIDSIICEDVRIKAGATINSGSILGSKVTFQLYLSKLNQIEVKANAVVPAKTKASMIKEIDAEFLEKGKIYQDEDFVLEDYEEVGSKPTFIQKNLEFVESEDEKESEDEGSIHKTID